MAVQFHSLNQINRSCPTKESIKTVVSLVCRGVRNEEEASELLTSHIFTTSMLSEPDKSQVLLPDFSIMFRVPTAPISTVQGDID